MIRKFFELLCSATLIAAFVIAMSVHPVSAFNGTDNAACAQEDDADSAIQACTRLLESRNLSKQNRAKLYAYRGVAHYRKGDYDRAIADYSEAIPISSMEHNGYARAAVYSNRGLAYYRKGDYDRAIADENDALLIEPKIPGAHNTRGTAYQQKGDNDHAFADYEIAILMDPDGTPAYANRGRIYNEKGDYDRALADCNKAIQINPKSEWAWTCRGNAYSAKGEVDRSIASYNESVRLHPLDPEPLTGRGLVYEKTAEIGKARADFASALAIPQTSVSERFVKLAQDKARERLAALTDAPPATAPVVAATPSTATAVVVSPSPFAVSDHRIAIVIGNSAYENVPKLPNPERDATFVAEVLRRTGFESVTVLINQRKEALIGALRDFAARAESADWAVVYYAGHGMEIGGINYLIPVDARIAADRDIGFEAVPLEQVLNAAERAKKLRLVILDACRDNPFANQMKRTLTVASRSVTRGLAAVEPDAGTLVVYAAKDGETAIDGDGNNSPFALAFVKNVQRPGLEVRRVFDNVRDDVMDATGRKQKPFSYGSISGRQDFYFVAGK